MSKWILIAIALLGLVYNVILMWRKMKEIRALPETEFGCSGEERIIRSYFDILQSR